MSVRRIKAGTTDVSVVIRIIDSTDGTPETGVVFNTSGIDLWYRRDGAASVDITEATLSALTDAHSDGGFLHINDGWYRLDLPDAACASSAAGVQIGGTVTGMIVLAPYIELEVNNATDVYTRIGAPVGASISADVAGVQSDTNDIQTRLPAALVNGRIDASVGAMAANVMTAAAAASDLTTELQNGLATAASITSLDGKIDTIDNFLDTEIAAILADTNELQTDWADGGRLDLILDARASQTSVNTIDDFLDTEVAAILAAVDTEVGAIKAVTDNLPDSGALTSLATQASVNTIDDFLDTEIAAIKAKTDQLTFGATNTVNANITHVIADAVQTNGATDTNWGGAP